MSGFLAMSAVSSTLRALLRDRMEQPVDVTIAPPDVSVSGIAGRRVNLYLYQVSENGALKNQQIPGRGNPADYGRPPLSLDLNYLVTTFGSSDNTADADLEAQQILGDSMRVFHEFPVVTESLHVGDNPANPPILDPSLVGEFEKVKITLHPAALDEVAKIWTALPQANFRRSVAYQVSVVQIESRRPQRTALPVRERRVYALPLRSPKIVEIRREPPFPDLVGAIAEAGDTVVILGQNLASEATRVRAGAITVPVAAPQDSRITLPLPPGLAAGLLSVSVLHDLPLAAQPNQPPVLHRGFESNASPLMLIPQLSGIAPNPAARGTVVTATLNPAALASQRKSLLLDDFEVQAGALDPASPPSTTVSFLLPPDTPPGQHLVRIRIDGAESRLTFNTVTGQYDGPNFTVL
ncbi:MAG TPA: Pvc16 family protein [Bryobacteraceae bacterium]|nr:Pvc16 family protein [Bryobacteraceae bacterium]